MTFQSPSERLASRLKDFVLLRRIDGFKVGRTLWFLALIVFGSMIVIQVLGTIELVRSLPSEALRFGLFYNSLFTIATMFIYILLVRLAIEVALRLLGRNLD